MTEPEAEQLDQGIDFQRYLNIVKRRHMQFLIPAFLGWLVVWGSSWFLQARFKSRTTILVEQPTMPKNYVLPNVNDDLQERLQSIKQQVLSRSRLLPIIDKYHLYEGGHRHLTADEKVGMMGKYIDIDIVLDPRSEQINAFSISYSSSDPHVAQAVANELAGQFINENLKVRQQLSENTTDFIKQQLAIKAKDLGEQERKVREFQAAHQGELPSQQASNLQILGGMQQQFQNEQDALNTAKQQRAYLQSEIDQYRSLHAGARGPDGVPTGLELLDQQIEQLRAKLSDLTSRYTDQYPDVVAARDQLSKMEQRRAALAVELKAQANVKGADAREIEDPTASAALRQLQGQFHANQLEIGNREKSIADLTGKINDYRARLNAEPAAEQQLDDLTRGYEQSKKDYDALLQKENDSEQATSMEQMQQGERFTALDPAPLPVKPDFPNRLKFCGMGLGAGIGLGLALVVGLEFLDDRMHSEMEIKKLLPVQVLTEIPEVQSPLAIKAAKHKMAIGWMTTGLIAVTILAGTAFSYLRN